MWSTNPHDIINEAFIAERLQAAVALRQSILSATTNAYRLVHSEADGLPGLIVDRFHTTLVFQILSAGMEAFRPILIRLLSALPDITTVVERSTADVRTLEGLPSRTEVVFGHLTNPILILENGFQYEVDPLEGHKTGFYLDQRDNRALVETLAQGTQSVLNGFCYTGGFTLAALRGGAQKVISIDSSESAIAQAKRHETLNGPFTGQSTWVVADMFEALRHFRDRGQTFDLIILDPPKFAPTNAHAERAARAYKDINLLAFKLLNFQGRLITFSCSGGVSLDLFRKIIVGSAQDAHVDALVEKILAVGADHPIRLSFPEGEYLKGFVLQKI
jgi:23S rRNA (cytosine1962-C5)-methyltransferase